MTRSHIGTEIAKNVPFLLICVKFYKPRPELRLSSLPYIAAYKRKMGGAIAGYACNFGIFIQPIKIKQIVFFYEKTGLPVVSTLNNVKGYTGYYDSCAPWHKTMIKQFMNGPEVKNRYKPDVIYH